MKKVLSILLATFISFSIVSFTVSADGDFSAFKGEGTQESPYMISSTEKLEKLADIVNGGTDCAGLYFKLSDDFDNSDPMSKTIGYLLTDDNGFEDGEVAFSGNFDGNGKKINLEIYKDSQMGVGLFGAVCGGTIENVVTAGIIYGGDCVGGVVGKIMSTWNEAEGKIANRAQVINCASCATVEGIDHVGGIVGQNMMGTCEGCYFDGVVYSALLNAGGIAGFCYQAIIENCCSFGQISGDNEVGGIAGFCNETTISDSYCACTIFGNDNSNAFCGAYNNTTVQYCYYNSEICEKSDGKAVGKNTAELQGIAILELLNFGTAAWTEREGDYPVPAGVSNYVIKLYTDTYTNAESGSLKVTYSIEPSYTVTIPTEVTLGESATISVEAVLTMYSAVYVTVSEDSIQDSESEYSGKFILISNEGAVITYSVKNGENDVVAETPFLIVSADAGAGSATLDFVLDGEQKYAGEYSNVINFNIFVDYYEEVDPDSYQD